MTAKTELLPCVEVGPKTGAKAAVIWMHGLGADGHDFEPVVPQLGLDPRAAVRFVFPHAPAIPVTLNGGYVMPAWYDIKDADLKNRHDEAGIRESARRIEALIAREIERGVPARKIVLAGFSQGGAMAVHVALRHAQPLAGLVALSTYLVCGDKVDAELNSANRGIAVFAAHGTQDPMVRYERGTALRDKLAALGCDVTWREYPMPHAVCLEEIVEIGAWLRARLGS